MSIENEEVKFNTRQVHIASHSIERQYYGVEIFQKDYPNSIPFYKNNVDEKKKLPAGHVIYSEGNILVSYRGTDEAVEWVDNFSVSLTSMDLANGEKVYVHLGFKHEYDLSRDNMEAAVAKMEREHGKCCMNFVGHSMGAAVAQIAALDQKTKNQYFDINVMTFGGPRVFCTHYAKIYDKHLGSKTLRVTHEGDPITYIPPKVSYSHVGQHITMPKDKEDNTHISSTYVALARYLLKKYKQVPLTK